MAVYSDSFSEKKKKLIVISLAICYFANTVFHTSDFSLSKRKVFHHVLCFLMFLIKGT